MEPAQAAYSDGVDKAVVAPPTRAEWVDSLLRRAIVHGELAPGEKLYAERLAEQWGVSATPLRETFQRLAGEGRSIIYVTHRLPEVFRIADRVTVCSEQR